MGRYAIDEQTLAQAPACVAEHGRVERWNIPLFLHPNAPPARLPLFIIRVYCEGGAAERGLSASLSVPHAVVESDALGPPEALLFASQPVVSEACAWLFGASRVELRGFEFCADTQLSRSLSAYMSRAIDAARPPSMYEMDARAYVVLIDVLRCAEVLTLESATGLTARDKEAVSRVIESSIALPLRVGELAEEVGLSEAHFARAFKTSFGDSPAAYILRRRAETARRLIEQTPMPLAEVAQQSGFSSQAHMTARLRVLYGNTPRALRLSAQNAGGAGEA